MPLDSSKINKILVISLTNIGDVILTFPVIDILVRDFPHAAISVVIGPKARSLFHDNHHIKNTFIFNKKQNGLQAIKWVSALRKEKFDLAVDLRHTAIPFLIGARKGTPLIRKKIVGVHMKDKHLKVLRKIHAYKEESQRKFCFCPVTGDEQYVKGLLCADNDSKGPFVIIAPGAADPSKRWDKKKFAGIADYIIEYFDRQVIFIGDTNDQLIADVIKDQMKNDARNLCGELSLAQLAILIDQCELMITNDTGPMHLASYLGKPTLAIFGPTDPAKYGPWNNMSCALRSVKVCQKCDGSSPEGEHECTLNVAMEEVKKHIVLEDGVLSLLK